MIKINFIQQPNLSLEYTLYTKNEIIFPTLYCFMVIKSCKVQEPYNVIGKKLFRKAPLLFFHWQSLCCAGGIYSYNLKVK